MKWTERRGEGMQWISQIENEKREMLTTELSKQQCCRLSLSINGWKCVNENVQISTKTDENKVSDLMNYAFDIFYM